MKRAEEVEVVGGDTRKPVATFGAPAGTFVAHLHSDWLGGWFCQEITAAFCFGNLAHSHLTSERNAYGRMKVYGGNVIFERLDARRKGRASFLTVNRQEDGMFLRANIGIPTAP